MRTFKTVPLKDFYARRILADLPGHDEGKKPWFSIQNLADDEAEVSIFDFIGLGGVSASEFLGILKGLKGRNLTLRLNSPGGDVFDGIAIYNSLRNHSGVVTVVVDGIAASAASLLAMAGETIAMNEGTMMMIHDPWALTMGNAEDHMEMANTLNSVAGELAGIYSARTGTGKRMVRQMMQAETWMTAKEARQHGFADRVNDESGAKAKLPELGHTIPEGFTMKLELDEGAVMPKLETDVMKQRLALAQRGELTKP